MVEIEKVNVIGKLLHNAVSDGINFVTSKYEELKAKGFSSLFIPHHEKYPSISYFQSELPYFNLPDSLIGYKVDYGKILKNEKGDEQFESWKNFVEYVLNDADLFKYFMWSDWNPPQETRRNVLTYFLNDLISSITDATIHQSRTSKDYLKIRKSLINLWLNGLSSEKIQYKMVIPILFHQPDCNNFKINENISIERINEQLQLSRNHKLPENTIAHEKVVGAATHALCINNILKDIPNKHYWDREKDITELLEKNISYISSIFSSFRLVTKEPIGFCQVIALPNGFQNDFCADLFDLKIIGIKKYPPIFEKGKWHDKIIITKPQLTRIKRLVTTHNKNRNLEIAERKLFDSELRENVEDSILDISTGFESLLSDSQDNIKYKISLRSATVCLQSKLSDFSPLEIRDGIRTFYDLRSSIIHANEKKVNKNMQIQFDSRHVIPTVQFGRFVLNHIIEYFKLHPERAEIKAIDDYLITRKVKDANRR